MSRDLPQSPSITHLRKQAKALLSDLRELAPTAKLADAQRVIARQYGFESWPKLKAHVIGREGRVDAFVETADASAGSIPPARDVEPVRVGVFDRYTELARRSLFFARFEASQQDRRSIGTGHLLLGLVRADARVTRQVFRRYGLSSDSIRTELHSRLENHDPMEGEGHLSSETRRVLQQHAAQEAADLGHDTIDTHHILLGLLHEGHSIAATTLTENGMRLNRLRDEVAEMLNEEGLP